MNHSEEKPKVDFNTDFAHTQFFLMLLVKGIFLFQNIANLFISGCNKFTCTINVGGLIMNKKTY